MKHDSVENDPVFYAFFLISRMLWLKVLLNLRKSVCLFFLDNLAQFFFKHFFALQYNYF